MYHLFTRGMDQDKKMAFDMELFAPPAGSELTPEVAERLREYEMQAFSALERQQG